MKRLLLLTALVAGCTNPPTQVDPNQGSVGYFHDAKHRVSCWTYGEGARSAGISCLPDKDVVLP